MFEKLFAAVWILIGTIWVCRPEWLRGWFARSSNRRILWSLGGLILFFAFQLLVLAWRIPDRLFKTLASVGVVLLAGYLWGLQRRMRDQVSVFWKNTPLIFFQGAGWLNIATGVYVLLLKHLR